MLAGAITIFPVGIFLAAALFVIAYVMWENRIVYKLTATEALGVGGATLIVICCAYSCSPKLALLTDRPSNQAMERTASRREFNAPSDKLLRPAGTKEWRHNGSGHRQSKLVQIYYRK